jgi:glycosyltransferase involved in cell wall biosynthesis
MTKNKLIRITTVATSLKILLKGQLSFMKDHYEVIGVSTGDSDLEDVATTEGVRVVPVAMTRTISPWKDLRSVYKLYRLFKQEKPMIVHTHTPKAGIVGMMAARFAGVKIRLHTVAGLPLMEAKGVKRIVLNWVEKLTYAFATKVYPNSLGLYNFIIEQRFCKAQKLKVIANGSSNGIDVSYFDPKTISEEKKQHLKNELSIGVHDFVFIFVGRLVGDKGLNELIAAFKLLSNNLENLKLLLVGDAEAALDPLHPETVSEMKTNPHIIGVGFQDDVRPYFAISDTLVFPTYREGFPNVVMQAGAMGLPAIVTNINGCNEIIVQGENGAIIPAKHTQALLDAMRQYEGIKEQNATTAVCRKMIVDRYQRNIIWEELLMEYKELEKDVS